MQVVLRLSIYALALTLGCTQLSAADLTLVRDGQPNAVIIGAPELPAPAADAVQAPPGFTMSPAPAPAFRFTRYWEHWGEIDDSFHEFTSQVKPQVVQVGFFGAGYYSGIGYALEQGKPGLWSGIGGGNIDREWWRTFIRKQHAQGIKVVGQFSLTLAFGDPDTGQGWFGYIDKHWDEKVLGPRPRKADGTPVRGVDTLVQTAPGRYHRSTDYRVEGGAEYRLCPTNPYTREILKRFTRAAVDLGLDGIMVVFPARENCVCEHCQQRFREYLRLRYTPEEIRAKFGPTDLDTQFFPSINGWYESDHATPLALEALKFSQLVLWECGRQCVLEEGRKIKPDLLVGQWNHIYRSSGGGIGQQPGTFAQLNADERCVLPTPLWAKDESWVWYSIGNWRFGNAYYNPERQLWGQFSLEHKYLRAAGRGLPQAVKRDDNENIRVYFAEALAHGGFAYARGPQYKDPATVKLARQCFDFARKNADLYQGAESYADTALVFPRSDVHKGDLSRIADFKAIGLLLTARHIAFDVVVDEMITPEMQTKYRTIIHPQHKGTAPGSEPLASLLKEPMTDATHEVVAVAWRQAKPNRLLLHLVNYKRNPADLPKDAPRDTPRDQPIAQPNVGISLKLPEGAQAAKVSVVTLDEPEARPLEFTQEGGRVTAKVGSVLVYSVVIVDLK
ncbi:MAG: hypothetical protein ACYC6A_05505 [Armatimonadota bacterium]